MDEVKALDILKKAILLEMKGKAFYERVAKESDNPGIRRVFETMAVEEDTHIDLLSRQYKSLGKTGTFEPLKTTEKPKEFTDRVLTDEIRKNIKVASYESAAISAAMAMEDRAVTFYSERAGSTRDEQEKEMYQWLADWEKTHLNLLADLDHELMQDIWHDQHFWPVI